MKKNYKVTPHLITITGRRNKYIFYCRDSTTAFRQFFQQVFKGKIPLDDIGQIIICKSVSGDSGKDIPFRTIPILYKMGLLDFDTALLNMRSILPNLPDEEIGELLATASKTDYNLLFGKAGG